MRQKWWIFSSEYFHLMPKGSKKPWLFLTSRAHWKYSEEKIHLFYRIIRVQISGGLPTDYINSHTIQFLHLLCKRKYSYMYISKGNYVNKISCTYSLKGNHLKGNHGNDISFTYRLKGNHVNEISHTYSLKGNNVNEISFTYSLKGNHVNEISHTYSLKGNHVNEISHTYSLKGNHVNEISYTYSLKGNHVNEISHTYSLKGNYGKGSPFKNGRNEIIISFNVYGISWKPSFISARIWVKEHVYPLFS